RLGLVFSGGPAPGGNNVAWGMLDCLERWAAESGRGDDAEPANFVGFLGGPDGLLRRRWKRVDAGEMKRRKNQGGFDLLGSGRTRLNTTAHFEAVRDACVEADLDGLVVCGGDDSNTNAAFLAEHLAADPNCRTAVVGVPKTIDDDLKGGGIGVSFGFDSASGVYAETIGNLCSDARSAGKYWHFVRVMGRNASHLTLECALRCAPNVALIGEEVAANGVTLEAVVDDIATLVEARAREGLTHGVVLVPEGLLAFVPDVAKLMDELARVHPGGASDTSNTMASLSMDAAKTAASLPNDIFAELTRTRDPHGNPRLSAVDTEKLLGRMVKSRIDAAGATRREEAQTAVDAKFSPVYHFCGYEGRSGLPTDFDATYAYALGYAAATLAAGGANGVIATVTNPEASSPRDWRVAGVPMCRLMRRESREGRERLVIKKTPVDLNGGAFAAFVSRRDGWRMVDRYACPGPVQFS
ncbi:predicted protein, partial [Micromonas commoda]